jgi:branched-chain amino acid transport system substrate-binding protein
VIGIQHRRRTVKGVAVTGVALAALALSACGSSSSASSTSSSSPSGSSATSSAGGGGTKSPIKIGTIGQFSGFSGQGSDADALALQAWVSTVNASGGVDGHPIELFVKDDANSASKSLSLVKELVEQDHVVAIVGQHESGLEGVWQSYIDSQHIPVIGGSSSGAPFLTDPNFYPVTNNVINTLSAPFLGAKLSGKTTMGLTYCAESPACAQAVPLGTQIAKSLGMTIAGNLPISGSASNYVAQCLTLKAKNPQAVLLGSTSDVGLRLATDCRAQGLNALFINQAQTWLQSYLKIPGWNGIMQSSDAPLWFGDGPGTTAYIAAMNKYQPSAARNASGTAGWYAGQVFALAVQKSGATGDITSAEITTGMHALGPNFDLNGILAPVTYTAGKPAVQKFCAWIMVDSNGKETAPFGYGRSCPGA